MKNFKLFVLTFLCVITLVTNTYKIRTQGNLAKLVPSSYDAYAEVVSVLGIGSYEVPDCGHPVPHITVVDDSQLNSKVLGFTLHSAIDNDRCLYYDRQRAEIKVFGNSPDWMKGYAGTSFSYSWKFKLDSAFKANRTFCHLFQIKDADTARGTPFVTLTARTTTFQILVTTLPTPVVASASLDLFKGNWVKVVENVTYGENAYLSFVITNSATGAVIMQYQANLKSFTSLTSGSYLRPKWGIYRSLQDKSSLKDETVLFADFCIAEGHGTCN